MKKIAFVVMPIENPDTEFLWKDVFYPTLDELGFDPKRIDRHTEGEQLKTEIKRFIEIADIVVAELTGERPNCYLEIGYVMGREKYKNLILCAREDYNADHREYDPKKGKVHFDLGGYDILWWSKEDIANYKEQLTRKIRRRLPILSRGEQVILEAKTTQLVEREKALEVFNQDKHTGALMEVCSEIIGNPYSFDHKALLEKTEKAEIHTFGWPIGVTLTRDDKKPRPRQDGISAILSFPDENKADSHFDYWVIKTNGEFYLLKTIFEDNRKEGVIFFDTRTVRMTEVLLYLTGLYQGLGVKEDEHIRIKITYMGLKGRRLTVASRNRDMFYKRICHEDEVTIEVNEKLGEIRPRLVDIVYGMISDLTLQFDFFTPPREVVEQLVTNYAQGKVV